METPSDGSYNLQLLEESQKSGKNQSTQKVKLPKEANCAAKSDNMETPSDASSLTPAVSKSVTSSLSLLL